MRSLRRQLRREARAQSRSRGRSVPVETDRTEPTAASEPARHAEPIMRRELEPEPVEATDDEPAESESVERGSTRPNVGEPIHDAAVEVEDRPVESAPTSAEVDPADTAPVHIHPAPFELDHVDTDALETARALERTLLAGFDGAEPADAVPGEHDADDTELQAGEPEPAELEPAEQKPEPIVDLDDIAPEPVDTKPEPPGVDVESEPTDPEPVPADSTEPGPDRAERRVRRRKEGPPRHREGSRLPMVSLSEPLERPSDASPVETFSRSRMPAPVLLARTTGQPIEPARPSTTGSDTGTAAVDRSSDDAGPTEIGESTADDDPASADGAERVGLGRAQALTPPTPWLIAGVGLLVSTMISTQLGVMDVGIVAVPVAGMLLAVATARYVTRHRPEEAWIGRWLVLGVCAKLVASCIRYFTLVNAYEGVGDATLYDEFGQELALAWLDGTTPPELVDLRKTNFVRWFTGVVYYLFGTNMVAGFFVFGLLAVAGSYLWYRATVDSVPGINRRLYLGLVLFVPSIAFWPASIGKEALMQFGIGVTALGTSLVLRQRLLKGLLIGLAGGWLIWVVRAHLLALVTVAAGFAYIAGRVRAEGRGGGLLSRPLGLLIIIVLMAITVNQGAEFLDIENLSVDSIEAKLDEQTERSTQGGSSYEHGGNSLNPLTLPQNAVTVLLRPFPWEIESPLQLLASLESVLITGLLFVRRSSLAASLRQVRTYPFLLFCWAFTLMYATAYSSFANFGLLVRQRSLILPALFVLVAVEASSRLRGDRDPTITRPRERVPG